MKKYTVATIEGNVVLMTDDLADAVNKCYAVDGFIVDENGKCVEC